jgi:catechol 2,3-dioxygenase-like lactoylglutathione lyase family enzyme
LLVRDLDEAVKKYWEVLGIGPWRFHNLKPPLLRDAVYYGKRVSPEWWLAVAKLENTDFELIQPVKGPSIYEDYLRRHGEGCLHHMKYIVDNVPEAVAEYEKRGIRAIQSGKFGEDEFAFFDTESTFGWVLEVSLSAAEAAERLPPPEKTYPPTVK